MFCVYAETAKDLSGEKMIVEEKLLALWIQAKNALLLYFQVQNGHYQILHGPFSFQIVTMATTICWN